MYFENIKKLNGGVHATLVSVHGEKGIFLPKIQYQLSALFSSYPVPDAERVFKFDLGDGKHLFSNDVHSIFPKDSCNSTLRIDFLKTEFTLRATEKGEKHNATVYDNSQSNTAIKVLIEQKIP